MNASTENNSGEYSDYNSYENEGAPCQNRDVKDFGRVFLPTLYSMVFIVGFIGNGLVACVLIKYRQKSNMADMCLLNLAMADLLFLISLPFWAHYAALNQWTFGNFTCKAVTAFYMLGFYSSIFFMILMTVDRYVVIVHSHISLISRRHSANVALACFMWILSLISSLPNMIFSQLNNATNESTCKPEYPKQTYWKKFGYIQLNFGLILPLLIMVFCYSQIIYTLYHMKSQKKHKSIRLVLVLVIVFFVFWTPYNVVTFLFFLHQSGHLQSCEWQQNLNLSMQWVETIAFSHCCLNPIIYAFVGQKFRTLFIKALKESFPACFNKCKTLSTEPSEKKNSVSSRVITNTAATASPQ
ncbi:C-C chemokine receptor type 5-like [Hoplias malabaricus]|uniref:C-C chemokine receptor type 5-like n=1 Tax=Hoplias malabaricus TaxID=27720 RepID=UPI00346373AF